MGNQLALASGPLSLTRGGGQESDGALRNPLLAVWGSLPLCLGHPRGALTYLTTGGSSAPKQEGTERALCW